MQVFVILFDLCKHMQEFSMLLIHVHSSMIFKNEFLSKTIIFVLKKFVDVLYSSVTIIDSIHVHACPVIIK